MSDGVKQYKVAVNNIPKERRLQISTEQKEGQLEPADIKQTYGIIKEVRSKIDMSPTEEMESHKERVEFAKERIAESAGTIRKKFSDLADHPVIKAFLNDCDNIMDSTKGGFSKTISEIRKYRSNFVIGGFDPVGRSQKGTQRIIEFGAINRLAKPDFVSDDLVNEHGFTPVFIDKDLSTVGIAGPTHKALFPSQFIGDNSEDGYDKIYYINSFVDEFLNITKNLLDSELIDDKSFSYLKNFLRTEKNLAESWSLINCFIAWGAEHEGTHTLPPLTFYEEYGAAIKSSLTTAAFEELRCDLQAIYKRLVDTRDKYDKKPESAKTEAELKLNEHIFVDASKSKDLDPELAGQVVLSERLLRYATQMDISRDFDSRASQTLFNYLLNQGAISVLNGVLHINEDINKVIDALEKLWKSMDDIEQSIVKLNPRPGKKVAKNMLANHIRQWGNCTNWENDTFEQLPYYQALANSNQALWN